MGNVVWLEFPINFDTAKCGAFEVKRRVAIGKLRLFLYESQPTVNQVQSISGSLQWIPHLCPRLRTFLSPLYALFGDRKCYDMYRMGNIRLRTGHFRNPISAPMCLIPRTFSEMLRGPQFIRMRAQWRRLKRGNQLDIWGGIGRILAINGKIPEYAPCEINGKSPHGLRESRAKIG